MSEIPNDSDRVSTAVLAERLRMYMQVNSKSLENISEEIHNVSVGIRGLDTRHDRLNERLERVEDTVKDVKDQVSKKIPVLWLRSTWAAIGGVFFLTGGILGIVLLLQRIGILH